MSGSDERSGRLNGGHHKIFSLRENIGPETPPQLFRPVVGCPDAATRI